MDMMLDGVVAFSNPNDVPIVWPANLILPLKLQKLPHNIKWNIKDALGYTKNENTADSPNFGLFLGRIGGGFTAPAAGFTLAPGQSATFGSTTTSGANLDLRPGFQPSGGVRMTGWTLKADPLESDDQINAEKRTYSADVIDPATLKFTKGSTLLVNYSPLPGAVVLGSFKARLKPGERRVVQPQPEANGMYRMMAAYTNARNELVPCYDRYVSSNEDSREIIFLLPDSTLALKVFSLSEFGPFE